MDGREEKLFQGGRGGRSVFVPRPAPPFSISFLARADASRSHNVSQKTELKTCVSHLILTQLFSNFFSAMHNDDFGQSIINTVGDYDNEGLLGDSSFRSENRKRGTGESRSFEKEETLITS